MASLVEKVRGTLKSTDTEGPFELYVTRTPGYLWALFFKALHVHPVAVTLMSIVIGTAAGVFFYFDDLALNAVGMFLLIWANWYDCADGQLARMTDKRTLIGRILDGFAGDVWFFSIYLFITLRLTGQPMPFTDAHWGIVIWLLCAWAGFRCHARQCAVSDYYRNIHMWMQLGRNRCELDKYADVQERYLSLKWRSKDWFEKLYLFFYRAYCKGQEDQTPQFQKFYAAVNARWGDELPQRLRAEFRQKSLPLMPVTNLLTFDFRVGVLFLSLLVKQPWVYPLVEVSLMEYWRWRMRKTHEAFCADFTNRLEDYDRDVEENAGDHSEYE